MVDRQWCDSPVVIGWDEHDAERVRHLLEVADTNVVVDREHLPRHCLCQRLHTENVVLRHLVTRFNIVVDCRGQISFENKFLAHELLNRRNHANHCSSYASIKRYEELLWCDLKLLTDEVSITILSKLVSKQNILHARCSIFMLFVDVALAWTILFCIATKPSFC